MDQSDAGSAGIFSQWTNQMQEARVYSHNRICRCREGRARHGHCGIDHRDLIIEPPYYNRVFLKRAAY
eukprot:1190597-Prorocentrum_minimum.AAC.2